MSTNSPTVLVVDDEKPLRDFVRRNLEVRNFKVETASNGLEALAIFNTQNVDLVIMDIMMPHLDGLETTRRIRQTSLVPIIILTALGEEVDKVRAFDMGADDYLTKPFGTGELLGRVKAVLRRARWSEASVTNEKIVREDIVADLERHEISVRGTLLNLTPTEFNLLVYMMRHAGKALSHRSILQSVWGPEYGEEAEYLRVYMGKLRQKIEKDPLNPEYLLTERGIGYRFKG
ncbi:MAG: response regulator transcription factor [Anaerolineae bacterium]|jgi:two-component system, OmpR family, KDP operon response regulator KdpE|nr:response regulator transcription factor [Anaerolineae bacterium]MBT7073067.1 response regulator transcription factor [Anaerolineae bacterium]MBT7323538.1 response regulator transcription factor [Anaerolineae bacterium]